MAAEHTGASVRTKAVASDMPKAASRFLDTPINGHSPRNLTNTKLLTRTVPTRIRIMSVMLRSIVEGVAAYDTLK